MRPAALLLLAVLAVGPLSGRAAGQAPARSPGAADAQLTVYLMTFGPGRLVYERFGHNAIWIHDPASGTDLAYNYGLFDFQQENFLLRFIRGQMWYWMDGFPADRYAELYRRDDRAIYLQELNLAPEVRRRLQTFLEWNARPEHRYYHYDYYRDNCSTRVRDALDRVLGGFIRRQTDTLPTGTTYRFHTQRLTANDPLIYTGLLAALGPGVDRPISAWEEMFLPMKLREHLREVTVPGPDGRPQPLVRTERVIYQSTAPAPPETPPAWLAAYLLAGVLVGGGVAALGALGVHGRGTRTGFVVLAGTWAVVAGTAGLVLAGMWAFTDHVMAYRNENLFQLSPLALPLALLLPALSRGARWAVRPAVALAVTLAAAGVLGLVLKLLPAFDQVNAPIIALALPIQLGLAFGVVRLARPLRAGAADQEGRVRRSPSWASAKSG